MRSAYVLGTIASVASGNIDVDELGGLFDDASDAGHPRNRKRKHRRFVLTENSARHVQSENAVLPDAMTDQMKYLRAHHKHLDKYLDPKYLLSLKKTTKKANSHFAKAKAKSSREFAKNTDNVFEYMRRAAAEQDDYFVPNDGGITEAAAAGGPRGDDTVRMHNFLVKNHVSNQNPADYLDDDTIGHANETSVIMPEHIQRAKGGQDPDAYTGYEPDGYESSDGYAAAPALSGPVHPFWRIVPFLLPLAVVPFIVWFYT